MDNATQQYDRDTQHFFVEDDLIAETEFIKIANTQHTKPIIPSSTATDADGVNVATNTLLKKDKNVETESVHNAKRGGKDAIS